MRRHVVLLLAALPWSGCQFDATVPPGARVACDADTRHPEELEVQRPFVGRVTRPG